MRRIITLVLICAILGGCVAHEKATPPPYDPNRAIERGMIIQMRGTLPVKGNETVGAMLVRQGDEWLDLLGHRASLDDLRSYVADRERAKEEIVLNLHVRGNGKAVTLHDVVESIAEIQRAINDISHHRITLNVIVGELNRPI
jgi:hypothetical protein